jgi:hypothetical protein
MTIEPTIMRVGARDNPYSQLSNELLRDNRLAWEARAVLSFILSHPPNWEFSFEWLRKQEPVIGRDRLKRHIEQLVDCGYCSRTRERNKDGTLGSYTYVFSDKPSHVLKTSTWPPGTGGQCLKNKKVTKRVTKIKSAGARSEKSGNGIGAQPKAAVPARYVTEAALDAVKKIAPGWDRQNLLTKFLAWEGSKNAVDLDKAFKGWVSSFTKGKPAS